MSDAVPGSLAEALARLQGQLPRVARHRGPARKGIARSVIALAGAEQRPAFGYSSGPVWTPRRTADVRATISTGPFHPFIEDLCRSAAIHWGDR